MGCERLAGFSGFYFNCWNFFQNNHLNHLDYLAHLAHLDHDKKNIFSDRKKPYKPRIPRFHDQTGRDRCLPWSGQEFLVGSIKRWLWTGQGETIWLNVCYYRERPLAGFEDVLPLSAQSGHSYESRDSDINIIGLYFSLLGLTNCSYEGR
jgi:hypothetical protein